MYFHYKSTFTDNAALGPWPVCTSDLFLCFPIVSLWELMTPGIESFLNTGTWLAACIIERITTHCYTQNMKALGLVVLMDYILCFSPMTGHTPGARLTGFIKRTFIHCYTQNMKVQDLVFSEKKICLMFFPLKAIGDNDPSAVAIVQQSGMVGRIYKDDHYTL